MNLATKIERIEERIADLPPAAGATDPGLWRLSPSELRRLVRLLRKAHGTDPAPNLSRLTPDEREMVQLLSLKRSPDADRPSINVRLRELESTLSIADPLPTYQRGDPVADATRQRVHALLAKSSRWPRHRDGSPRACDAYNEFQALTRNAGVGEA